MSLGKRKVRLSGRYRELTAAGKPAPKVVVAIARELVGFIWAIVRNVAWKAQVRLSGRYRELTAAGKPAPKVVVAIARELVGFIWAIARMVEPKFA